MNSNNTLEIQVLDHDQEYDIKIRDRALLVLTFRQHFPAEDVRLAEKLLRMEPQPKWSC